MFTEKEIKALLATLPLLRKVTDFFKNSYSGIVQREALLNQINEQSAKIAMLEDKNRELELKIEFLINPKASFHAETGTWIGEDGLRYCPKCRSEHKASPLKNEKYGWDCPVCGSEYSDPDRPVPTTIVRNNYGSHGSR